jgi:hypothetical protein
MPTKVNKKINQTCSNKLLKPKVTTIKSDCILDIVKNITISKMQSDLMVVTFGFSNLLLQVWLIFLFTFVGIDSAMHTQNHINVFRPSPAPSAAAPPSKIWPFYQNCLRVSFRLPCLW